MAKLLSLADARSRISSGGCDRDIARYYACGPERPEQQAHYRNRFLTAIARFQEIYGGTAAREIAIFSAPDLPRAFDRRFLCRRAFLVAHPVNILDHNDRIIYQHPHSKRKTGQRDDIQSHA